MSFSRYARLRPFAIERFLMLRGIILGVHVLLALMIIGLVLLQRGKGAEAGAGFGSGASGTVFGARGTSTLFSKLTAVFAALFFLTSLSLAYLGTHGAVAGPNTIRERQALHQQSAPPPPAVTPSLAPASSPAAVPAASAPASGPDPVKK